MMEVRDDICDDLAELALVVAKSVYKNETLEASYKISVSRKVKELTSGKDKVSNAKAEAIAEVEFADLLTEWKENAGITKAGRMVLSHFSSLEDSIKQRISNIKKTELGGV